MLGHILLVYSHKITRWPQIYLCSHIWLFGGHICLVDGHRLIWVAIQLSKWPYFLFSEHIWLVDGHLIHGWLNNYLSGHILSIGGHIWLVDGHRIYGWPQNYQGGHILSFSGHILLLGGHNTCPEDPTPRFSDQFNIMYKCT